MLNRRSDIFSLPIILFFLCVSSQAIADKFPIANSASPETSYDIAFDGTNFLVAIEGETVGAQLVSPSGELIGSFISTGRIGSSGGDETIFNRREGGPGLPQVAFDGTNYLLVWTEGWTAEGTVPPTAIFGLFISPSGSTVGEPFEIRSDVYTGSVKGIAYGGGQYVVAYTRGGPGGGLLTNYYSRTVSVDGDLGPEFAQAALIRALVTADDLARPMRTLACDGYQGPLFRPPVA